MPRIQGRVSDTGMTVAGILVRSLIVSGVEVTEAPTVEREDSIAMATGEEGRMCCACRRCRYTLALVYLVTLLRNE